MLNHVEKISETQGISDSELKTLLEESIAGKDYKRVLIIPPGCDTCSFGRGEDDKYVLSHA